MPKFITYFFTSILLINWQYTVAFIFSDATLLYITHVLGVIIAITTLVKLILDIRTTIRINQGKPKPRK